MIQEYVADIAAQVGIQLSEVSVCEYYYAGCFDSYMLYLSADKQQVSALVHQSDLDGLKRGLSTDRLEVKIRSALSRLQMMLAP